MTSLPPCPPRRPRPPGPNATRSPERATGAVYIASSATATTHATIAKAEVSSVATGARVREIERLRLRVKELEEQCENHDRSTKNSMASPPSPPASSAASPTVNLDPLREYGGNKKHWEGIYTSTARSHQTQCYGPSSSFYFIGRMSSYLGAALQQPHSDHYMQPNSASMSFASPTTPRRGNLEENLMADDSSMTGDYLTGTQEEYFLGLFWQSYHCILQILDEVDFREHYKSLWATSGTCRKPSALVDIVLAICMQYGVAFIPRGDTNADPKADVDSNDATIAGRWFYRRCQALLTWELESPSITTLQCHIFSVIYLCNASFQNMAHSTLALAVRTAHILGLHLEPPEDMPRSQKELRKRLWWTLYAVESKTCMKLGRPWSTQISQVNCSLPADDHELVLLSGSNFASSGENVTWLTYNLQNTRLVLASRAIYVAFFDKCTDVLGANNGKSLYHDPPSLEICAEFLLSSMKCLQMWLHSVPDALKTKRKNAGEPFSTDRSALEVELFAPLWLQRQRLLLELLYHNLAMNLYRPFICFSPASSSSTPLAEGHAVSCVNHAIAITHIMHQMLTETDILSGWHEAFQWQWNATLSMIGFILAYPVTPSTPSARKAINSAIGVFENFGNNFAIAASAANVTRDLTAKADFLIDRFRTSLTSPTPPFNVDSLQPYDSPNPNNSHVDNMGIVSELEDDSSAVGQNALAGAMGLAFTVDSFNSFEPFYTGSSSMSDTWTFTQDGTTQFSPPWPMRG
ncbi:MAG: hypothetical protein M1818_001322 [Claussenomyces sp. TS43310]|nr:MAG: hypothetical protein M1818_001322 [Claussenomyces sp. TS43310]